MTTNILTATPEDMERLAGEILLGIEHDFVNSPYPGKYCNKCASWLQHLVSTECRVNIPLTWPEAMKYFRLTEYNQDSTIACSREKAMRIWYIHQAESGKITAAIKYMTPSSLIEAAEGRLLHYGEPKDFIQIACICVEKERKENVGR